MSSLFVGRTFLQLTLLIFLLHATMSALLILSDGISAFASLVGIGLAVVLLTARNLLKKDQQQGFYFLFAYIAIVPLMLLGAAFRILETSAIALLVYFSWLFFAFLLSIPLRSTYRQFTQRKKILQRYLLPDQDR